MKKRLMSLLLTAAMIVSMVVVPAAAADPVTLTVGNISGKPGEQVTVAIDIAGVDTTTNIGSIQFDLTYDTTALEFVSGANGSAWASATFEHFDKGGIVSFGHFTGDAFTTSGTIATATFNIKTSIEAEETPLSVTVSYAEMGDYTEITNSIVTVEGTVDVIYPATATTGDPEQTSVTSAILNGSYTALDGVTVSVAGIKWGTSEDNLKNKAEFGAEVSAAQNDTIYYQAYATVGKRDYVGEIKSITLEGPKADGVTITEGADSITVTLEDNTTTYTAAVVDQFGDTYKTAITWSLVDTYEGVSINASTGVVTVTKAAMSGEVTIQAAAGEAKPATKTIAIVRPDPEVDSITASADVGSAEVPTAVVGETTVELSATGVDQFEETITLPNVEWIISDAEGVSIKDNIITITNKAEAGVVTVTAKVGDVEDSFELTITKADPVATTVTFDPVTDTLIIPTSGEKTETHYPVVTDQFGAKMENPDSLVTYEFKAAADQDDSCVTLKDNTITALPGEYAGNKYVLTATLENGESATKTIEMVNIVVVAGKDKITKTPTYGMTWAQIVTNVGKGTATLEGKTVYGSYELAYPDAIPNAGEDQYYIVKFTADVDDDGVIDYDVEVPSASPVSIAKKEIKVTWSGYKDLTYGDDVNVTASAEVALTVENGTMKDAGSYTATAKFANDADDINYILNGTSCDYTIVQAVPSVELTEQSIRAGKTSAMLLDQMIEKNAIVTSVPGTLTIDEEIDGYAQNTKRNIKVTFTPEDTKNYEVVNTTVTVTFTKGDPQTISVENVTATYGDAAIANAATVTKGGKGAISYVSDNESVATVAADGTVTIVGVGSATVTVTVAAEGDWAESYTTYTVTVAPKTVTVSRITAADKVYDAKTDAVVDVTNAVVVDKVGEDDVTVASAKGAFADANVGEQKPVAITDIVLTGAAVKNYVLSDEAVSAFANITKANATVTLGNLKQKPGKVEAVTVTLTPATDDAKIKVEYYIAPVEETACDHVGDKLCTADGSACQHTDCGCSYVAPSQGHWTKDIKDVQAKGEYPVRVTISESSNVIDTVIEDAGTLVVKKSSSGGGGSSAVTPPAVEEPEISFVDVEEPDWFYDYVIKAVEKGLFAGTDDTHFSPDMEMNRAMMVTVMAALEFGAEGAPEGESDFTDLTADWYKNAVAWASNKKVTAGISDTKFGPDLALTREQVAVFLYAYAQLKGYDVSAGSINDIVSFNDVDDLSDWASTAMQWACAEGLLEGTPDGDLLPKAVATRAQVAVILVNFEKLING